MKRIITQLNLSLKLLSMLIAALMMFGATVHAQGTTKVTGVVKDAKGETLIGVSILLKGTKTGTASDGNGKFTISVPDAQAVLVFTYIGFTTREVVVGSQKTLNITLTENAANSLNEVVVTGYGQTVKKRDLTSAISSVSAKEIEERQPLNLFDALQGQAAGVLVVNDGGEPGAEGSITVRGPSTFSNEGQSTNPLYVIDGVITPNAASINPSDIQSIEVLKDAASAAIYGSRSANGVILITTKHGVPNKPRIDAQFVYTIGKMAHKIQETNPADLRYYRRLQSGLTPGYGSTLVDSLNPGQNSDNDLEQLVLGTTSHKSDAKISLAGGSKDLSYAMSLNYLDDQGTLINTYTKKLQSRINADYQFLKFMKYSTNLSFMRQTGNYSNIGNQIRPAFDRPSSYIIYYPNGDLASFINGKRNPIANSMYEINTRDDYRTQFVNTLAIDITKDLKFTTTLNAQYDNAEGIFFSPRFVNAADGASNAARNSFISRFFYEAQAYANYNKVINKNHTITATIGVSRDRARLDTTNLSGTNFVLENVHTVTGGNITNVLAQRVNFAAISTGSYFARLGYNYKSRYIAQFVYRNDASSRFGPDSRSAGFPAGSIAWRFTDEPFMKWTNKALDDGKLRFSYGAGGNDAAGPYDAIPQVETGVNSYNGVAGISATANEPNPTLKWETTIIKDLGIDLTVLKSRLTLTADAYIRTTNDLLYNAQVPKETGYTVQRVNVGTIENKGLEIVLAGTPVVSKNFNWTVNANISFERGKIVSLNKGDSFVAAGSGGVSGGNARFLVAPGERIGNFYGWKNLGVYQYDASNAYTPDGQKLTPVGITATTSNRGGTAGATVATSYTLNGDTYTGTIVKKKSSAGAVLLGGDTEWQDTNNDGVIDDADRVVLGNAQPNVYLGFVNNFTYKRFSLSFIINATLGGKVYNQFKQNLTNFANTGGPSLPEAIYGAWTTQGDIARYPYYPDKDTRGSQRIGSNSMFLEDGSFIRLSSARFTYRLEPKFAQKVFAKNLALYIYGVNLLTYTNYTGFDPEFSPSSPLTPGDDTGRYPKRRELGFGINVGF
ncbi:TonB-dependent receptor [Mucilaginibacter sp. HMF5004]|uniref:SusC/RagA family TonB-linked outer membrane protein n=1 Tax=Mucilaginibacter rivuli TaxID=2857527 RepID=UPI001C5E4AF8|nr:TonB-dependent receptor [Mucilaginibacter rivuli]MBW4888568.1 TonB-dependent receptor [Mucilaginibacter rivuli]